MKGFAVAESGMHFPSQAYFLNGVVVCILNWAPPKLFGCSHLLPVLYAFCHLTDPEGTVSAKVFLAHAD